MAKPFLMFDNAFEDGTLTSGQTAEAMQPVTNVTDWRISTPHRWVSSNTSSGNNLTLDLSAGAKQTTNCGIFSGHNLNDAIDTSATGGYTWQISSDGISFPNLHSQTYPETNLPIATVWDTTAAQWYWRLRVQDASGFEVAPQIGHAIIGLKLEFSELMQDSFRAYDLSVKSEESVSVNGSMIGSNLERVGKEFRLSWDSPGMTEADFFNPSSGLTFDGDFVTHAIDNAKPFYFIWDIDEAPDEVWICRTHDFTSTHVDTTARRRLNMVCHAWREVA